MTKNDLLIKKIDFIIEKEKEQFLQGVFFENIEEMKKEEILFNFLEQLNINYFDILYNKTFPN